MKKLIKIASILVSFLFLSNLSIAQVGIGIDNPDSSSALEINSSNKGFLMPRINLVSTIDTSTITSPANGLMVYNLSSSNDLSPGVYVFDGTKWNKLTEVEKYGRSRVIKNQIGFNNVVFSGVNANNNYGNYLSLFNEKDDAGTASFHMYRSGTPTGDWGFAMELGETYTITEVVLDGRDACCTNRVTNIVARLYLAGALVYTSDPITTSSIDDNFIFIPNIAADEVRLIVPLGGDTGAGQGVMNFTELELLGYKE